MSTLPSLLQAADIVRIMGIGRNEYIATMVQVGGMDGWVSGCVVCRWVQRDSCASCMGAHAGTLAHRNSSNDPCYS